MVLNKKVFVWGAIVGLTMIAAVPKSEKEVSGKVIQSSIDLSKVKLPDGFKISLFATGVTDARSLACSPDGKVVFVGNRRRRNVYALVDQDGDMKADKQLTLASGWSMPNGVAYYKGDLYVAEVSKVHRFPDILNHLENPVSEVVYESYPTDRHHGWKFIAFGPDGKLYVPVGAPCNVCDKESQNPVYATITRMNPDGSQMEIYAKGVRNSVGFAWHPKTGEMWFTDNGRDMMGDDKPACELNRAPVRGMHFGFPYWHEGDIPDPEFGEKYSKGKFISPAYKFEPHSAPLGLRFYQGDMFPEKYRNNLLVAQHGSWNRSPAAGHTGYQLRFVQIEGNQVVHSEIFASGWLDKKTNTSWGRPVDVLEMPDGSVLVSDDQAGCIYRISYEK